MNTTADNSITDLHAKALEEFLNLIEIPRFRKNLRTLLLDYIRKERLDPIPDFDHFIEDMKFFFNLLDDLENVEKIISVKNRNVR